MTRYVLYNEEPGIFLRLLGGFICCSNGYTGNQNKAVTFPDKETTLKFGEHIKFGSRHFSMNCRAIPVECADDDATVEECVAAGLPAWRTE